ncbi:MAG: hypothetical protein JJE51_07135 [Thermoanaerobaculia bacterium]|nr:hypothetical protein [Thermoanaerobaculia bacterium]
MRRQIIGLLILIGATAAFAHERHQNVSVSVEDEDQIIDCSDVKVMFAGERATMISDDIPFRGNSLRLRNENHGGIRVTGGSAWGVKVCKAVAPGSDPNLITIRTRGDEIVATGPDKDRWIAYFLITAPRGAMLDLYSTNGPISLDRVDANVTARAVNGPVSVKGSSGTIDATTTNGPISLAGGSGTVKLAATNGPVSVKLDGKGWNGSLDATTQNGPVSLKIPRGYQSGIVVEALGHGPISCKAEACPDVPTRRGWSDDDDRPRRIELGAGRQVVHLATTNGPLTIKESD